MDVPLNMKRQLSFQNIHVGPQIKNCLKFSSVPESPENH